MSTEDLKYLATYPSRQEAEMMEGLLNENGIKCLLQFNETGDVALGVVGYINGPTDLWVMPDQFEKAHELVGKPEKS